MRLRFFWPPTAISVGLLVAASALPAACGLHASGLSGAGGGDSSTVTTGSSSAESGSSATSTSASSGTSSSSSSSSSSGSSSSSSGGPPVCGNKVIEAGEECDDGSDAAGDGCSPTCLTEHPEVCPGTAISLVSGKPLVIKGDTTGAGNKFTDTASVGGCPNGFWIGSDLIYAVTPATPGKLAITLATKYDSPLLHVRTQCPGAPGVEIACEYSALAGSDMATIMVSAGTTYYVAVDSWAGQEGTFALTLALQ